MTTELRNFGDGRTIIIYTDDNDTYRKLRDSTKCFKLVPYCQENGRRMNLIGADFYYDKKYKPRLIRTLGLQKVGVF